MKLTKEVKQEINGYSIGKIVSLFRFHPCEHTTGEVGKYVIEVLKEKVREPKNIPDVEEIMRPRRRA